MSRPEINVPEGYWDSEYAKQRQMRMQDAIDDYLQDDTISATKTYREMLDCVEDVIKYHERQLTKATELYNLMQGNEYK